MSNDRKDLHGVNCEHEAGKGEEDRYGADPSKDDPVIIVPCVGKVHRTGCDPHGDKQEHIVQGGVGVFGDAFAFLVVDDNRYCDEEKD